MKTVSETTVKADFFSLFCFLAIFFSYHDLLVSGLTTGEEVDGIGINEANMSREKKKPHTDQSHSKAANN